MVIQFRVDNHNISVRQVFSSFILISNSTHNNEHYSSHKIDPNYSYTLITSHKTFMSIMDLRFYYT